MKTMKSRMLIYVSTLFVLACVVMFGNASQASATSKTADDAINWVRSQLGKGLDYDHVYGNQCVDLIKYYYAYLGVTPTSGNGCDYSWNSLPAGWSRIQGAQPQKGDVLVYSGNSSNPYGHVAIYESDRVHYHQNFDGHNYVQTVTYRYNGLNNPYWGVIRPNWYVAPSDGTAPTISNVQISNVTLHGYTVTCTATDNVGVTTVKFPTWRVRDTSNGCPWDVGTRNGNTWSYTYKGANFGDAYLTHVYAYDAAGNYSAASANVTECVPSSKLYQPYDGMQLEFQSHLDASKVLSVTGSSTVNHANVELNERGNEGARIFTLKAAGGGYYYILNNNSGKYLDVYGGGATNLTNLNQYEYNGSDAQKFRFVDAGNGYYYIGSKLGTYVDDYFAKTENGNNILMHTLLESDAQKWKLVSTDRKAPVVKSAYIKEITQDAVKIHLDVEDDVMLGEYKYYCNFTYSGNSKIALITPSNEEQLKDFSGKKNFEGDLSLPLWSGDAKCKGYFRVILLLYDVNGNQNLYTVGTMENPNGSTIQVTLQKGETYEPSKMIDDIDLYRLKYDPDDQSVLSKSGTGNDTIFTATGAGTEKLYLSNNGTGVFTAITITVEADSEPVVTTPIPTINEVNQDDVIDDNQDDLDNADLDFEEQLLEQVTLRKVTAVRGKKAKVVFDKDEEASGYQIAYSTKRNFKKFSSKSTTKTSYTLRKLARKTYYVKVRSYAVVDGVRTFGEWSRVKKVRIRK